MDYLALAKKKRQEAEDFGRIGEEDLQDPSINQERSDIRSLIASMAQASAAAGTLNGKQASAEPVNQFASSLNKSDDEYAQAKAQRQQRAIERSRNALADAEKYERAPMEQAKLQAESQMKQKELAAQDEPLSEIEIAALQRIPFLKGKDLSKVTRSQVNNSKVLQTALKDAGVQPRTFLGTELDESGIPYNVLYKSDGTGQRMGRKGYAQNARPMTIGTGGQSMPQEPVEGGELSSQDLFPARGASEQEIAQWKINQMQSRPRAEAMTVIKSFDQSRERTDKGAEQLSKRLYDTGLKDVEGPLRELSESIPGGIEGKGEIPGVGGASNLMRDILYQGRAMLGEKYAKEAVKIRNALSAVKNLSLKERSGAAVTDQELKRFEQEMASTGLASPDQFRLVVKRFVDRVNNIKKAVEAGVPPEGLQEYLSRGGTYTDQIPTTKQEPGKKGAPMDWRSLPDIGTKKEGI